MNKVDNRISDADLASASCLSKGIPDWLCFCIMEWIYKAWEVAMNDSRQSINSHSQTLLRALCYGLLINLLSHLMHVTPCQWTNPCSLDYFIPGPKPMELSLLWSHPRSAQSSSLGDPTMRPSASLLQHTARVTLFTRANCSLCDTAKSTISRVATTRSFELAQVDVMAPDQRQWKDLYEFDTPVVCILLLASSSSMASIFSYFCSNGIKGTCSTSPSYLF